MSPANKCISHILTIKCVDLLHIDGVILSNSIKCIFLLLGCDCSVLRNNTDPLAICTRLVHGIRGGASISEATYLNLATSISAADGPFRGG